MDYNLHTHTFRCSHAEGTEREYIEKAISSGIKMMGFSDHFPWKDELYYRVPTAEAQEYIKSIRALRDEYKDKIEILIGFEIEYICEDFDEMVQYARELGCEYLIHGQHFVGNPQDARWSIFETEDVNFLKEYVDSLVAATKSGVITYLAHPDIIGFVGDEKSYIDEMKKICIAAKEYDVPLEINFQGIRHKRHYPDEAFWKIAGEVGCPVVFGFDAHEVDAAGDTESLKTAMDIAEKYNLKVLDRPTIKRI